MAEENKTSAKQISQTIRRVLEKDERLWDEENKVLNETLLLELLENIDQKVISLLIQEKSLREKFFIKAKDVYVFKTNDFRFFMEENKVDNSYTSYVNRIGLTDGNRFLKDTNDVVLGFPYKDCVLEGGQSTEEGTDIYFEYDEKVTKTQKGQGMEAGKYNKKTVKREEIFFNKVLAHDEIDRLSEPKAFIHWKRYTKHGEEEVKELKRDKDGNIKENLIIKGNNLLALHSLKKQFSGRIKLIYIDPPYNTGDDEFGYNNNFSHSTWLTFMKNRLELAKELLSDEGLIFIQCDHNEQAYLKVLMDDKKNLFGRDNFVSDIAVSSSTPSGLKTAHRDKTIIKQRDSILVYKKKKASFNPQYKMADKWDTHYTYYLDDKGNNLNLRKLKDVLVENKIMQKDDSAKDLELQNPQFKSFYLQNRDKIFQTGKSMPEDIREISLTKKDKVVPYGENQYAYNGRRLSPLSSSINTILTQNGSSEEVSKLICDFWDDIDFNNTQNEGGVSFPSGKKPELLLHRIINMVTDKGDIILDYHLGSGTTCAVAHKMGRQYIGIEQLDYGENDSVIRLQNVINEDPSGISKAVNWEGGGDFVYLELAKWNELAKEQIQGCNSFDELIKFFDQMYEKYFLNYNLKLKEFKEKVVNEKEFKKLSLDKQKEMFITMLDNNQMYVNMTEMQDKKYGINKKDQNLTQEFYKK